MTSLARRLASLEQKATAQLQPAELDVERVTSALKAKAAGRRLGTRQQAALDAWQQLLAQGHRLDEPLRGLSVEELRTLLGRS